MKDSEKDLIAKMLGGHALPVCTLAKALILTEELDPPVITAFCQLLVSYINLIVLLSGDRLPPEDLQQAMAAFDVEKKIKELVKNTQH